MHSRVRQAGLFGLGVAAVGALLSVWLLVLELEESAGLQWLFRLRGPSPPPDEVIVVGLSGASADEFGLSYHLNEWPRSLHADLIDRLVALEAAVIVMDITFENASEPEQDGPLARSIERAGNVILLERVRSEDLALEGPDGPALAVIERRLVPIEMFRDGALATAPFTLPKVPVKTSQFWAFGRADSNIPNIPAVALQAYALPVYEDFAALLAAPQPSLKTQLPMTRSELAQHGGLQAAMRSIKEVFRSNPALSDRLIHDLDRHSASPDDRALLRALIEMYSGTASRYLNYYGPAGSIRTVHMHDVLRSSQESWPESEFAGKVVFVGFSERRQPEQDDDFISVYSERSGLNLSGVEIGATAFANLLTTDSVRPLSMPAHLLAVFVWGVLLTAGLASLATLSAIIAAVIASVAYLTWAWYQFASFNVWLPLVVPLVVQVPLALSAAVLLNYRELNAQRERIQAALGHYVPAKIVAKLAQETFDARADRELVHGTCLVSDAEQFTRLSESLPPVELAELMDDYYRVLRSAAERHGGFVADLSGDSMVATWTQAKPSPQSKRAACLAAFDVLAEVDAFNREHGSRRLPTRIGLDSGEMLLGSIGSAQRYQYRAVGDIVNTASRIQGLNKLLATRILLSDATLKSVDGLITRRLGRFLLLGKTTSLDVYELLDIDPDATARHERLIDMFSDALDKFARRDWSAAQDVFRQVLAGCPEDGPSGYYVDRCNEFATRDDLPEDWAGTIRVAVK